MAVIIGALLGGHAGLVLVEIVVLPGTYHSLFGIDAFLCAGLGLVTGYLPGIAACWASQRFNSANVARLVGFGAAVISALAFGALVAAIMAAGTFVSTSHAMPYALRGQSGDLFLPRQGKRAIVDILVVQGESAAAEFTRMIHDGLLCPPAEVF